MNTTEKTRAPRKWKWPRRFDSAHLGVGWLRREHAYNQHGDNLAKIVYVTGDEHGLRTDEVFDTLRAARHYIAHGHIWVPCPLCKERK